MNGFSNDKNKLNDINISTILVALLLTAAILLAGSIGMLFLLHADQNKTDKDNSDDDGSVPTLSPGVSNGSPLYPTVPTRDSYLSTRSPSAVTLTDQISSNNTILVELGSYTSIVEKNADAKIYPASMTKVMTLLVACENVTDLTAKLNVTAEAIKYKQDNGASGENFTASEALTVKDLLYLVIYDSNSIACQLLAEHVAESESAFVELMNAKARQLGLSGTQFANSTGIYSDNNYSTCRDIAAIMAYALDNELARKVLLSYEGYPINVYDAESGEVARTLKIYNDWYSKPERFKNDPKLSTVTLKAGKTGYIEESGVSLVTYGESSDGKKYINVIVGRPAGQGLTASQSTQEVKYIYNNYAK